MGPEPLEGYTDSDLDTEFLSNVAAVEEFPKQDTITNNYMEEVTDPENISPYNYDQYYHLNPSPLFGFDNRDYSGVQEYLDKITKDPDNPNYKRDEKELLRELIKDGYILEGMPQ